MTRAVTTFAAEMKCIDTWRAFRKEGLRRAPVVHEGRVLGMVTDRDLLRVLPLTINTLEGLSSAKVLPVTLREILSDTLISVSPGDHLETAARLMLENRVGGLPVMQDGELAGIITESDLFRVFVELKERAGGVRLTFHWPPETEDIPDPARVALATGVEIREHFRHESPAGGELVGLRLRGPVASVDEFQARMLRLGFLLIDREDFERPEG